MRRAPLTISFVVLACVAGEPATTQPATPGRTPSLQSVAESLSRPVPIPGADQLGCHDAKGALERVDELPRGPSLAARAMWLFPVSADRDEDWSAIPPLVLEQRAEQSVSDRLSFRRTPGELTVLLADQIQVPRECSDRVRGEGPANFEVMVTGVVGPRGRVLELDVGPADPSDAIEREFAACVARELAPRDDIGPWLYRHTPRYTRFTLPLTHVGRPDPDRRAPRWHRLPPSVGVGRASGCVFAAATIAADELAPREPVIGFVGVDATEARVEVARTLPEAREHGLAIRRLLETKVEQLEACRPGDGVLTSSSLVLGRDNTIAAVLDESGQACIEQVLLGLTLPFATLHREGDLIRFTVLWSSPGLGLTSEERALLRKDENLPRFYWPDPVPAIPPSLADSPRAAELCPAELGLVHEHIINGFGRVGEAAELATHELALALLADDPRRARACIEHVAEALGPILTWPAPLIEPPLESIGLYEAAARTDEWLAVLTALDAAPGLRHQLGCFLRRAQRELIGTLELRDEASLPDAWACSRVCWP